MCARRKQCVFLNNKEVYCHQHNSLGPKEQRVLENDMRVDHCVLIHTDNYRAGRKITKTIPPQSLKVIFGKSLLILFSYFLSQVLSVYTH